MKITCETGSIKLEFPAANRGKYRFKTRAQNIAFGSTYSARKTAFDETVYLEWQIGYDAEVGQVASGDKTTTLTKLTFVGANGKTKYPYELSEILFYAVTHGLVSLGEVGKLLAEISGYNEFIDQKEIIVEEHSSLMLNGLSFAETSIKLPTLFLPQESDGTQIEISIQKQQYASGVQPMVYFCIPFQSFENHKDFDGRASKTGEELIFFFKKANIDTVLNMFRVFGMASARHNIDTKEILKVIIELLEENS